MKIGDNPINLTELITISLLIFHLDFHIIYDMNWINSPSMNFGLIFSFIRHKFFYRIGSRVRVKRNVGFSSEKWIFLVFTFQRVEEAYYHPPFLSSCKRSHARKFWWKLWKNCKSKGFLHLDPWNAYKLQKKLYILINTIF